MRGAIVFGIWLAIDDDAYQLWDGWILASLVLWAVADGPGARGGQEFERDPVGGRSRPAIRHQAHHARSRVLVILVLMIWKPGA